MAFSKALYYPTIDINDEGWLKSAILFWDEIQTIVPETIEEPYSKYATKLLFDEGLLKPFKINPNHEIVENLSQETSKFIQTEEAQVFFTKKEEGSKKVHKDKVSERIFSMHPDKLPYEIQNIIKENVDEGWLNVSSNFAEFYMSVLANKICENQGLALLTDNPFGNDLSSKVKLDNHIKLNDRFGYNRTDKAVKNLAEGMLTNLVLNTIVPDPYYSIHDIVKYKKDHRDELGRLKVNISSMVSEVNKEGEIEAIQQNVIDIYNNEFKPAYNDYKASLSGFGFKSLTNNFVKMATFSVSGTALPVALLGMSVPWAILGGLGIGITASLINYNIDKKEKIRKSPYSYLMNAQKLSKEPIQKTLRNRIY